MFDMVVDTGCVRDGTGYCLRTKDYKNFVFFIENAGSIKIDLSGMPRHQKAILVDACSDYSEIKKGPLTPGWQKINFARTSDWAIAVGDFKGE
jgi:hypothetical protein